MANHKNLILSLSLEKEIMSAFLIDGSVQVSLQFHLNLILFTACVRKRPTFESHLLGIDQS